MLTTSPSEERRKWFSQSSSWIGGGGFKYYLVLEREVGFTCKLPCFQKRRKVVRMLPSLGKEVNSCLVDMLNASSRVLISPPIDESSAIHLIGSSMIYLR